MSSPTSTPGSDTHRGRESPGVDAYFSALEEIFRLESRVLTAVLPHMGERGRNDEDRARAFLARVLPRRFSIGTGFLVCSNRALPISPQIDIVIYDEIYNSPLHRELAAFVYPIEMVYGTVEVKGLLSLDELDTALASIARVRRLAEHKVYVTYETVEIGEGAQRGGVSAEVELGYQIAPRSFIFAFDCVWETFEGFQTAVLNALKAHPAHLHGVVVMSKGWYLYQAARKATPVLKAFSDRALMRFTRRMLSNLSSMKMGAAAMGRYLTLDDPGEDGSASPGDSRVGR